ncbi:MAG: hypothetical protein ACJAW3_000784 [Lentimonas sp.]|jgi:hypothetical protein
MKNLLIIIILPFLTISCSKYKISDLSKDSQTQNISQLPEWIITPDKDIKEGVYGVGIASKSIGGIKFQIPQAETDARANIAVLIGSEMSRITKDALRESKIAGQNDIEQVFTQATKEVVKNMPLSGAKRTNIYQGKDETIYIRMVLRGEDYSKYLTNSKKIYDNLLNKADLSRDNLNKAQAATKNLFDELDLEKAN